MGSFVKRTRQESRIPREQVWRRPPRYHTWRQYLQEVEGRTVEDRCTNRIKYRHDPIPLRDQRRHAGTARLLRQLSVETTVRDRGSAGHSGAHESGDGGRAKYADRFADGKASAES